MKRAVVLLLCVAPIALWSYGIRRNYQGPVKIADFSTIYFAARCVVHRRDPYDKAAFLQQLAADRVSFAIGSTVVPQGEIDNLTRCVYLPTALLAMIPLALLSWMAAQNLFLVLTAGTLVLAGLAAWDLGSEYAPLLSGSLACYLAANCMLLMLLGNPAGLVAGLCVVAAWCLLKNRYAPAGVALLSLSLMIKPHDAGFVWLYFLLAGGMGRKRALETLAVTAVLGACAAVWIAPASPHWTQELHSNLAEFTGRGGYDDPGPSGPSYKTVYPDISLQGPISIWRNDPGFYNPAAYLIGGGLILAWLIAVLRKRSTQAGALLAVTAISLLTLLPVYHRSYDAKLLMLTVPGCAILWAGRGMKRWAGLGLTAAAVLVTSDIPAMAMFETTKELSLSPDTVTGKLTLMLLQPAPLVILAAGCFYLWVYMRFESSPSEIDEQRRERTRPATAAVI